MSSKKKVDMTAEEIEAQIERKNSDMTEGQRNGNYVEAENCRVAIEQLKKDYEVRRLYELNEKQKQENSELARSHDDEIDNFNKFWDKKMEDYSKEGQRM